MYMGPLQLSRRIFVSDANADFAPRLSIFDRLKPLGYPFEPLKHFGVDNWDGSFGLPHPTGCALDLKLSSKGAALTQTMHSRLRGF